jgi:NAD(P)-dependent dehydrogenase (short-subunit alcohol dehydrogenase family)
MNKPVVLITGALTGIGRATALAFTKDGASLLVSAAGKRRARLSKPSWAAWVPKPSSSRPTFAAARKSATRSTRPSHGLAVSMSR